MTDPIDHVKIAKYVKKTLLGYFGDGMYNFTDTLLERRNEGYPEDIDYTAGWGHSHEIVASGGPDGLVGDTFKFSTSYSELDAEGNPVGREREISITLRVVQCSVESLPRDDDGIF